MPPEEKIEKTAYPYPIASFALDLHLFKHTLEFSNATNLRSFDATIQAVPTLKAEFYPLAFTDLGLFSGIGLDIQFGYGLGLKTKDELEHAFPMNWMLIDGGLRWRLQFSKTWGGAVTPMLGVQHISFSHGTLEDGTELSGFPKLNLTALRIGVGFELPFASNWVVIFGDFSILPVLSAKDILAEPYFPEGSAFGMEGKLGVGVKIIGPLHARLSGFYSRTNFNLKPAPGNPYSADKAFYQRVGAQLGVYVSF